MERLCHKKRHEKRQKARELRHVDFSETMRTVYGIKSISLYPITWCIFGHTNKCGRVLTERSARDNQIVLQAPVPR